MSTVIRTPPCRPPLLPRATIPHSSLSPSKPARLSFRHKPIASTPALPPSTTVVSSLRFASRPSSLRFVKLVPFSSQGETGTETETTEAQSNTPEDSSDGAAGVEDAVGVEDVATEVEDASSTEKASDSDDAPPSVIISSLQAYKEALASNNESQIAEIEAFLKSFEDEKTETQKKVAALTEELAAERDRVLRISADFDNFRKRTERERLSLVTNSQGEVVEKFLPVLDNFERAKTQIKAETEGEAKINNSYQSVYKQFMEILGSLRVVPVDTVGNPFDPMLHEAIMRDESTEFEEGVIIEEYQKGFKLGDRLLRPSMVKVSAGPGPAKPEQAGSLEEADVEGQPNEEGSTEAVSESAE
ncbi:hypothetical protein Tsubulata_019096 [Turnera subulata]|uniref:GrpE protein homolog n=1 Tax=Turnera subulata TaxID=218843 RepID=A0A9Q0GFN2_9ROSI|nr:hypothetical protein Tsubulata_019096 [Turnera subulata]